MSSKSWSRARALSLMLIFAPAVLAGCDKEEEESAKPEAAPSAAAAPAPAPEQAAESGVKEYPDMVKMSGTVRLLRSFNVYEAADSGSKRVAGVARNTLVDLKFRRGNWVMINYPSGVGELSPGWIQARVKSPNLKRVTGQTAASAAATASAAPKASAAPSATASAEPAATASAEPAATASAPTPAPSAAAPAKKPAFRFMKGLKNRVKPN